MKQDDCATRTDGSSVRVKNLQRIAVVVLAFATGLGIGIYSAEKAEPVLAAPLVLDFCSLATNQDYLVGARIQTTSKMSLGMEGGVLESESCPDSMLVFRAPKNDRCWQEIISAYDHNPSGPFAAFSVQIEGRVSGRRGLVSWVHDRNKPFKDAAHRHPMVTIDLDKITSCTKE